MSEPEEEEGPQGQAQNERVNRVRPRPTDLPARVFEVVGFLGDSDRPGYARLYLNRALTYYMEFPREDAQFERVPQGEHPVPDEDVTRVMLPQDAQVEYVRSQKLNEPDEFDIDVDVSPIAGADLGLPWPISARICPPRYPHATRQPVWSVCYC